ncbi:MAG TPA: BrnT family toxin [Beijerinckiaceae bacterium]|jgi:hypothetical protein
MFAPREFEWDEAKAESNEAKHGFHFEHLIAVFLDPARVDYDVSRPEEGEFRRKSIGLIEGRLFTVVYTLRGPVHRIISARKANPQERKRYGDCPLSP